MKILVIQQKMIGDVLFSSVMFEALRTKYPDAQMHFAIYSNTIPVIQNNPYIDRIIDITPEIQNSKLKLFQFLKIIKKEKYDIVIDVHGKLRSNLMTLFSKAKIRISYHKNYTSFLYSNTIVRLKEPENNASLAIENRMKLLEPIGVSFQMISPKIYLEEKEIKDAKTYLEKSGVDLEKPLYLISVLGSKAYKSYPEKYMATLINFVVATKSSVQILFNYSPNQEEDAKRIFDYCSPETQKHIFFNVYGKSLREFLAIVYHCDALIGNEGGANNMVKALNKPTFSIFIPYLHKHNWFGKNESNKHVAIHLADYVEFNKKDYAEAKKNPRDFYLKLKPELMIPELESFLNQLESGAINL